jgi:hypothetical protein
MQGIIDFLVETKIMQFATDPRVVFLAGSLFLLSLFMKWRILALSLFGVGALVAVARYSRLAEGKTSLDQNMLVFALGSLLVMVILMYFLFIRGD